MPGVQDYGRCRYHFPRDAYVAGHCSAVPTSGISHQTRRTENGEQGPADAQHRSCIVIVIVFDQSLVVGRISASFSTRLSGGNPPSLSPTLMEPIMEPRPISCAPQCCRQALRHSVQTQMIARVVHPSINGHRRHGGYTYHLRCQRCQIG